MATSLLERTETDPLAGARIVDVDTHLSEVHDLWTSRAPASLKDRVPQVKEIDGKRSWTVNGDMAMGSKSAFSILKPDRSTVMGWGFWDMEVKDVHPASYDVKERLKVMDEVGIWGQIVYPNVLGFGGQRVGEQVPEDIRFASIEIYNDAMAEMQADSGDRVFPMALMPWWDVPASVREAERCRKMGLRGINTNSDPHLNGLPDLGDVHWDPLWEALVGLDMPVNFHIGASDVGASWHATSAWPSMNEDRKLAISGTMMCFNNARVLANIFYSGMLDRHEKLKIVSVESGIGWVPFLLEMLDYQIGQMREGYYDGKLMPSEYFKRQIYACFWFEQQHATRTIEAIGADNVMFETDFPHPTALFPNPRQHVARTLAALDQEAVEKIVGGNATRVYNLPTA